MMIWRFLLAPFALIFGILVAIRNQLYDSGILSSWESSIPSISIGNLSAGGTGKTPMTEYLVRLLHGRFKIATLSRGYGRSTSGFILADVNSGSAQIGDEPVQFKKKFPDLRVAVDGNRKEGIRKLIKTFPDLQIVLLDDAFQHRRIKPGLSILLTDYGRMYYDDFLLPAGTLREWSSGKKRADVIIVTKCPDQLTPVEKRVINKKIFPDPHQHVFFSFVKYGDPIAFHPPAGYTFPEATLTEKEVFLLTGISNPRPLEDHFINRGWKVHTHSYRDHHEFTLVELAKLREAFGNSKAKNKVVVTTEKDAMRLDKKGLKDVVEKLPVFYLPIETAFDEKEKGELETLINNYIDRTLPKH